MTCQHNYVTLHHGNCLDIMPTIEAGSVDMVLADPPYGTTACKWDSVIPFEPMWASIKHAAKRNAAIALFGSQPFTSALVMSNVKMFKYCWVWDKVTGRGHLVAKKRPMAQHEDISVFYGRAPVYTPQMVLKDRPERGSNVESSRTSIIGGKTTKEKEYVVRTHSYPKTIQRFGMDKKCGHPTQKPVALMEYLIKTYTNEGDTVLDFTMGSGTTGVACANTGRKFIGIELDAGYFEIASRRVAEAYAQQPNTHDQKTPSAPPH